MLGLIVSAATLRAFGTVLGALLFPVGDAGGIQSAADDMVANAGQVAHLASAKHNNRVLLERVSLAGDISCNFLAIGKADSGNFTES